MIYRANDCRALRSCSSIEISASQKASSNQKTSLRHPRLPHSSHKDIQTVPDPPFSTGFLTLDKAPRKPPKRNSRKPKKSYVLCRAEEKSLRTNIRTCVFCRRRARSNFHPAPAASRTFRQTARYSFASSTPLLPSAVHTNSAICHVNQRTSFPLVL